jgi:ketosteroid isomerase-like protein
MTIIGTGPESITMTEYFPLSSGWVTDNWTLSIDIFDHDVNGVLTKAMADTRHFPAAYYWTNDDNGLRLHKIKRYDPLQPFEVQFSSPIKWADAECPVGSIQEGTRTACENGSCFDFIYSIQFVDFEDITTPAGNFSNCAKFKSKFYPVGESPDDYGYETLWLGKNVGFVKAQSDINAEFALFADKGEFRQLISYHLTPPDMTQDEIDVRNAIKQAESYFRQKDLTNFMAMIDDNYLDYSCRTKPLFEDDISNFWDNSTENWNLVSIEEILFDGPDYAYVVREWTRSYKWTPDQSYESRWSRSRQRFKKQVDGSWKVYGNQNQIYLDGLNVVHVRRTPSVTALFINAFFKNCGTDDLIQDPDDIINLTVSGPPGSDINAYDMKPHWVQDENGFRAELDISKAVKGYYTFEWTDKFGSSLLLTDYLSTTSELPIPVLISPINDVALDSGIVDFQWEPVAGANGYKVEVFDAATDDIVLTGYTNINAYTNPDPLPAGKSYKWRVKARYYDEYGDMDSQSRCDKENFSINLP